MVVEIAIVVVLVVLNGVLAMSELAVVSARPARLKVLADQGSHGAATAIRLAEDPGRFLSSVQIGITLVGVLSGAFSGATLGARFSGALLRMGFSDTVSDAVGVGVVVVVITYLSLIVGELVPKQVALRDPEGIAARVAPAMRLVSRVAAPLVFLLDQSGKLVLRLIGQGGETEERMTEEEVKTIIAEAETAGVLETEERAMIAGVMRLADREARALMTPRGEVELIDARSDPAAILSHARRAGHSRLPVRDGGPDDIVGVVLVRELLAAAIDNAEVVVGDFVREAPTIADHSRAFDVLARIRSTPVHMGLVFDEYGHFEGIVTSADVLGAITGAMPDSSDEEPAMVQRDDGSFLVSGWMPVDEFAERFVLQVKADDYATVAGFVLATLNRVPEVGECFTHGAWRIEVVDLDGRRIDKLLVSRVE